MHFATLKSLKPSEFSEAADGYRSTSDMAGKAQESVDNEIIVKMRDSLKGDTTDASIRQLQRLSRNFHYTEVECGLISTALNGLAHDLQAAQKKLREAIADAEGSKFTVGADGSVSYPAAEAKTDGKAPGSSASGGANIEGSNLAEALQRQANSVNPNPNHAIAQGYANRISQAVQEATEADAKWAPKLRSLKADDDLAVSHGDWADAQKDMQGVLKGADDYLDSITEPPKGGSPKENAEWWQGLSAEERESYAALHPASIGAMDGLPAEVRDSANRTVLAETRGRYELELSGIPQPPKQYAPNPDGNYPAVVQTEAWKQWNEQYGDRYRSLNSTIGGMDAIQARLKDTGKEGLPPAYLLGFDDKGTGRAIVANGNPDEADHTAVYVPGTFSSLPEAGGDIKRMTDLWLEGNSQAPNASLSTVTWIGYDAPQSLVPEAMGKEWALDGAPELNQFLDGLQAVQGGADNSHTTVIGHSYGSTTVGAAALTGDLSADDVVAAGSPGMLVADASELDVGKDHVWSETAGDDRVVIGGKVAGLGGYKWDVHTWNGIPYNAGFMQMAPSDEAFGAHRMTVDTEGHSGYWDEGSQSLKNQASVVVGKYDDVKED
ncbi:alpha/beta hydrolase [Streptomyces luteolus]|uniref:Alpha/beta hydrolase n=1 Tax=Streptomyces luteolus TaxID=3043615 RepID=A0ABT6SRE7_9ACTN|nr:alpha/beta hydrolase [Streptomyces sp. B-S-A12]MDI3417961.1 alpha/beta hydrolase [Streptomyces sp. B-S-A12]